MSTDAILNQTKVNRTWFWPRMRPKWTELNQTEPNWTEPNRTGNGRNHAFNCAESLVLCNTWNRRDGNDTVLSQVSRYSILAWYRKCATHFKFRSELVSPDSSKSLKCLSELWLGYIYRRYPWYLCSLTIFLLVRYTAVYRDHVHTGIMTRSMR